MRLKKVTKELLFCCCVQTTLRNKNLNFNLISALYSLEEDWTDIVRNSHMLSEKARSQQTALWELVETEVAYIRTLKVIQDVSCIPKTQKNLKIKMAFYFSAVSQLSVQFTK